MKLTDKQIHRARTMVSNWCNMSRKAVALTFMLDRGEERALRDDGIAIIPDFLSGDVFCKIREEANQTMNIVEENIPIRQHSQPGFGPQEPHAWGFDRYDGGTLNRYVDIQPAHMPYIHALTSNRRITRLCRAGLGMQRPPRRSMIYLTVNGNEDDNHDIQKDLHRDSYSRKMKYWYFIDPVTDDDGPFVYVPGSHKLTQLRLEWECEQACIRGIPGIFHDSSFRMPPLGLAEIGLPAPQAIPVAANTLVIADTFGFHRRGDAIPGSRRLAIYGQKKPWPFVPIGV